jgi:hypothetical protein
LGSGTDGDGDGEADDVEDVEADDDDNVDRAGGTEIEVDTSNGAADICNLVLVAPTEISALPVTDVVDDAVDGLAVFVDKWTDCEIEIEESVLIADGTADDVDEARNDGCVDLNCVVAASGIPENSDCCKIFFFSLSLDCSSWFIDSEAISLCVVDEFCEDGSACRLAERIELRIILKRSTHCFTVLPHLEDIFFQRELVSGKSEAGYVLKAFSNCICSSNVHGVAIDSIFGVSAKESDVFDDTRSETDESESCD